MIWCIWRNTKSLRNKHAVHHHVSKLFDLQILFCMLIINIGLFFSDFFIDLHSNLWVDCITIFRHSNISRCDFIWRPMLERNDILNHKTMSLRNEGYHMMALKNLDVTMYTLWHISVFSCVKTYYGILLSQFCLPAIQWVVASLCM